MKITDQVYLKAEKPHSEDLLLVSITRDKQALKTQGTTSLKPPKSPRHVPVCFVPRQGWNPVTVSQLWEWWDSSAPSGWRLIQELLMFLLVLCQLSQTERKAGHLSCNGDMVPESCTVVCKGNSGVTYLIISVHLIHALKESRLLSPCSQLNLASKRLKCSALDILFR